MRLTNLLPGALQAATSIIRHFPRGLLPDQAPKVFFTRKMGVGSAAMFLLTAPFLINGPLALGQTLQVLHYFQGAPDGANPEAGLAQGPDGNFYGVTAAGGVTTGATNQGTVFRITPAGVLSLLHVFDGVDGNGSPATTLVLGTNGNFYGTANFLLFSMMPSGGFTTLTNGAGGASGSGLMPGSDGNFYGANDTRIYQMTPEGVLSTLYQFPFSGALQFYARLAQGADGSLYGIDMNGGANSEGAVFHLARTPDDLADTLTNLVDFAFSNGSFPIAGLVAGNDGNFYGTTRNGTNGYPTYGTVFRMTTEGSLTTLFTFHGTDGSGPLGLLLASDGNFYGTTSGGGAFNDGTVFRMTPNGMVTTLVSFAGTNGANPQAELVQGADGHFYGTTYQGGFNGPDSVNGYGTVFRIVIPPASQTATQSNGVATFTWSLIPGEQYQVQYGSDLISTNWVNLGDAKTATNTTVSVSDPIGSNPQRFYRVMLTR